MINRSFVCLNAILRNSPTGVVSSTTVVYLENESSVFDNVNSVYGLLSAFREIYFFNFQRLWSVGALSQV
jgi:hypothetical protein